MAICDIPRTIWWDTDEATGQPTVYLIDQTRLPLQGDVLACHLAEGVCTAISSLAVRGAPALGVAAALALAEALGGTIINADASQLYADLHIISARPSPAAEALVPHLHATHGGQPVLGRGAHQARGPRQR